MWFIHGNKISQIDTLSGMVQEFDLHPTNWVIPTRLKLASDGAIWFPAMVGQSEQSDKFWYLGKITTNGVVSLFPLNAFVKSPGLDAITSVDSDRSVWFATDKGTMRSTMQFDVTSIVWVPPGEIVVASNGHVCWTQVGNQICCATPAGMVLACSVNNPANVIISDLLLGFDGHLWFMDQASSIWMMDSDTLMFKQMLYLPELSSLTYSDNSLWMTQSHMITQLLPSLLWRQFNIPVPYFCSTEVNKHRISGDGSQSIWFLAFNQTTSVSVIGRMSISS